MPTTCNLEDVETNVRLKGQRYADTGRASPRWSVASSTGIVRPCS